MCLYVGTEVILANLLSRKDGVSKNEVILYSQRLKKSLSEEIYVKNVYISINDIEIESALLKYDTEFRRFQGRYFINKAINLSHFNSRYDDNIISVFEEVAQTV